MRTKEIVGAILALTIFLGLASIALADAPGTPFQVGGHVYLGATIVSGAAVTVTNQATGEFLTDTTESTGAYVVSLSNLPGGHSAGDTIQVTATYNGQTGTSSAPRSASLSDSPQIIDVTLEQVVSIAIRAEDGGPLPESILVGETFTVLITEDGSPVGAGTNVTFRLPYDTGSPTLDTTDADGKAQYLPQITGILGIRVLDATGTTVANANVTVTTTGIQTLGSVVISPDSADLLIGETQPFTAICYDTSGNPMSSGYTLTWNCDTDAVGTIDSSGLFTAGGVGTATVTVTATQGYVTKTATAVVNVSAPTETVLVDGTDFPETPVPAGTAATITVNGTFDSSVTGSIDMTAVPNPEDTVGSYAFTGYDEALMGLTVTPDAAIAAELADGNGTIRIEICYNATELESKGISSSTLAIYRYNVTAAAWEKMVAGTPPCIANGITGTCAWITVNDLSTFALVGTKTTPRRGGGGGGGGGDHYPPGWGGTPTATPGVTPGAAPGATPEVTPPGEAVTKPTKPAVAEETAPEGAEETPTKKKGTPGFTAVFAIAGLLAIAYAMMRRRD